MEISGIEAVGVTRLGQQLPGLRRIVGMVFPRERKPRFDPGQTRDCVVG